MIRRALLLAAAFGLVGCDKPAPGTAKESPAFAEPPPVVAVPPVQTIPYEEGYALGFARGRETARRKDPIPPRSEVETLASAASGDEPARNEKWRSGWAAGYLDGFRQTATGAK
jgi:hypothetical protein